MLKEQIKIHAPIDEFNEYELSEKLKIRVLRAKDFTENINLLNSLVLEARKSYRVYGDVPLLDEYDEKSAIYIATADYTTSDNIGTQETITMRVVPVGSEFGEPFGTEDLDFFVYEIGQNKTFPIHDVLEHYGLELNNIASISRLGKIPSPDTGKNEHIAELFAAIQLSAMSDSKKIGVDWIICQLHNNLQNKSLALDGNTLEFVPIEDQLGINSGKFTLDRNNNEVWKYMMKYPGYFLDTGSLKTVLENPNRTVSKEMIDELIGKLGVKSVIDINWFNIRGLGEIISGKSDDSTESNGQFNSLNSLIKSNTKDGVFLALMKRDDWRQSSQNLLDYARLQNK